MINKKLTYQELENQNEKLTNEIIILKKELVFQSKEKGKRANELIKANKELIYQSEEKANRADELFVANKELVFQNNEKAKRAAELIIANKELFFQNEEKAKRSAELLIANILKEDNEKWINELVNANLKVIKSESNLQIINEEYEAINEELRQTNDELIFSKRIVEESESNLKTKNEEFGIINEELRQTNDDLFIAKSKAEESERLKSAFLSNMSHEIRTPLNIITGYSEFLAENNLSKVERTEYISLINTNSIRLFNLIDNILDLSKIEAGQKIVNLKIFNINKLMDELFDQNKKEVEKKQLELCVHKELENEQALINSSEQLIYQIFTNLLNNAFKYSVSGRIDYGYIVKDKEIELFVSDAGIGISKEYVSNLFKRFSQENSALSRTYEGAGLGLSIVKGIVELLRH